MAESVTSSNETTDEPVFSINDLGEYELIKIFSYFPIRERITFSSVCLKWKNVIDKSFKSVSHFNSTVLGSEGSVSKKEICLLIRKCCNVRHIDLKEINLLLAFDSNDSEEEDEKSFDNIVVTIANNCIQLQSIDFGSIDNFDEQFITFANFFSKMKKIVSQYIGESGVNSIIDSQHLEVIDISRNDNISRPDFKRLGPKISEIHLIESQVFDQNVIRDLCEGNGKQIKSLSIDIREENVLSLICNHLKQLKHLKLCLYSEFRDFTLFSNLIDLKTLVIEVMDESKFKPQQFTDLVRSLKRANLLELNITLSPVNNIAINDESLQEIRTKCQSLEKLVIRGANSLTGAGMYALAQLKCIKHLDLKDCLNITDAIDIVITSCSSLRDLILHNCSHIGLGTVDAFINKAKENPNEKFYLDVIDTNVSQELDREIPPNSVILFDYEYCKYDCDHGWGADEYDSGPENHNLEDPDLDFYEEEKDFDDDFYDDYDDEDSDDFGFA